MMLKPIGLLVLTPAAIATALKGVAPENVDLYAPQGNMWQCLDQSKSIPASAINDDYCDCPDGSDEPGTSACPQGVFYCQNAGYMPGYINSWSVNDGVCDEACCDGSDETNGLVQCPNRCAQLGADYDRLKGEWSKVVSEGMKKKAQLSSKAELKAESWQQDVVAHRKDLVSLRAQLKEREDALDILEEKEKSYNDKKTRMIDFIDSCLVHFQGRVQEHRKEIDTMYSILENLKKDYNPNFNDMGVKKALEAFSEFESNIELKYDTHDDWEDLKNPFADDDKVSPEFSAASEAFSEVNDKVHDLEKKLNDIKEELNTDYGPQREWMELKDTCVNKTESGFTYTICLFGSVNQDNEKDGSSIFLGRFAGYDHERPQPYSEHLYEYGTRCWNGPDRHVRAIFSCGTEVELVEVSEPSKCEYVFHLRSPAVCTEQPPAPPVVGVPAPRVLQRAKQRIIQHEEL